MMSADPKYDEYNKSKNKEMERTGRWVIGGNAGGDKKDDWIGRTKNGETTYTYVKDQGLTCCSGVFQIKKRLLQEELSEASRWAREFEYAKIKKCSSFGF